MPSVVMGYRALLDANVLVPARVRDVLLTLAHEGLYVPVWTSALLDEIARNLPEGMNPEARGRLMAAMAQAFPDALIPIPACLDTRVAGVINPKDRHVVAAAIVGGADVVVTEDKRLRTEIDDLSGRDRALTIDAQGADTFVGLAVDIDAPRCASALITMARARWLTPGQQPTKEPTNMELLDRLISWCDRNAWTTTAFNLRAEHVRHTIQLPSTTTSVEP